MGEFFFQFTFKDNLINNIFCLSWVELCNAFQSLFQAMRELDRERVKMEQQEKKLIADIKKMAKQGRGIKRNDPPIQMPDSEIWL